MLFKIVIETDNEATYFQTVTMTFRNTVENPDIYTVDLVVKKAVDNKVMFTDSKKMYNKEALNCFLAIKRDNENNRNLAGFDTSCKQTFITKKNPYISREEYIKRFLWE